MLPSLFSCVLVAAYFTGSIPTGFLVAKSKGIDIRTVGSGNIGATNAFRVLGRSAGIFVLAVDALKGFVAVQLFPWLGARVAVGDFESLGPSGEWLRLLAGLGAILGHNFPCWLKFKGGKGIATSAGVMLGLVPLGLLIALAVWLIVFWASRYVSLASVCAAFALPFAVWLTRPKANLLIAISAVVSALAIYKHRSNIRRLWQGTEHRFGSKNKPASL